MKVEWFEEAYNWKKPEDLYKICIEQQKEIERLNKELEFEKLKNKEVREYIDENVFHSKNQEEQELYDIALLEILDKENT